MWMFKMDKRVSPVYRNKMEFVDEHLPSEGYVLDVGCGAGHHFHLYKNKNLKFVGVEPEEDLIQENMINASAEEIPFQDELFDCVVCADVMEHVDDPEKSINEIKRSLKDGGKLILTVPNKKFPFVYDPINWILGKFNTEIRGFGIWAWGHKRLYDEKSIKSLIEDNGFKIHNYEGRSRNLVALSVGFFYFPWIANYIVSPIMKKFGKGGFKNKDGIENSKVYKFYTRINELDKKKFKNSAFINHCIVAEKLQ